MTETIELVKSDNGYAEEPLGSTITVYIGEPSVRHPNVLVKSPVEFPKILQKEGAKKTIKANVNINRSSASKLSEDRSKLLADNIAGEMRKQGFLNCTFKYNPGMSGIKVYAEGKAVQAMTSLGANAYSSGQDVNFGNSTPQQKILGHEAVHTVQQRN